MGIILIGVGLFGAYVFIHGALKKHDAYPLVLAISVVCLALGIKLL